MDLNFQGKEGHRALFDALEEAGCPVTFFDNQPVCGNPSAAQDVIDAFTIEAARAPVIEVIKAEAQRRILLALPEWRQRNLSVRLADLTALRFERDLTAEELAEVEDIRITWGVVTRLREASTRKEAELRSLPVDDYWAVLQYDVATGWPE